MDIANPSCRIAPPHKKQAKNTLPNSFASLDMDLLEAMGGAHGASKSRKRLPPQQDAPVSELSLSLLRQNQTLGNFSLSKTQLFGDEATPKLHPSSSSKIPSPLPSSPFLPPTPSVAAKTRPSSTAHIPKTPMNATQKRSGVWRYTGGQGVEAKEQPAVRSMAIKLEMQYDNAMKVIAGEAVDGKVEAKLSYSSSEPHEQRAQKLGMPLWLRSVFTRVRSLS